jgi:hypothetical protein
MADQPQSPETFSSQAPDRLFTLWNKYEDVAMHFNDLIMRWRLQAIGGLAGLVTLAGFVVGDAATLHVRYRAMLIFSGVLMLGWIAVACIDLFYYRRLLQGAVDAILELERKTEGRITLSLKIEDRAEWGAAVMPWLFYSLGLVPLVALLWWATHQLNRLPPETPTSTTAPIAAPAQPTTLPALVTSPGPSSPPAPSPIKK